MNRPPRTTAILLAAGGSTRLGRPKQLLHWDGTTLLGSTIKSLVTAGCERLIVVLGAYESEIREHCVAFSSVPLDVVTNVDWIRGQATSLRVGIEHAIVSDYRGEAIVALCDQPLIDSEHYQQLISRVSQTGMFAAATEYPEGLGVPACFSFSALLSLSSSISMGDSGAKKWLRAQKPDRLSRVQCPQAAFDIDTDVDYRERMNHAQIV